jgi:hypothetical protein
VLNFNVADGCETAGSPYLTAELMATAQELQIE